MYRIFYDYKDNNDVLSILFLNNKITKKEVVNNVTYYYNNKDIIQIDISNISEYVKIKTNGMIINPIKDIVNLINNILKNNGDLITLPYNNKSGFIIGHILEKDNNFYQVDIGKVITIIEEIDLKLDSFVIVGEIGSILSNKQILSKYKICTSKDIGIDNENNIIYIDKDKPGKDYFLNKGE